MSKVFKKFILGFLVMVLVTLTLSPPPISNAAVNDNQVSTITAKKTYPTEWTQRFDATQYSSAKLKKASKAILAAAIIAAFGKTGLTSETFAKTIASALLSNFYVNSETQDVYYSYEVYYRELGPGKFDSIGNFLGDYQIKVVETTYSNVGMTKKISSNITYYKSTSIFYW